MILVDTVRCRSVGWSKVARDIGGVGVYQCHELWLIRAEHMDMLNGQISSHP